ncbi:MAG: LysR family transcriptional regulator [Rhodospirillaceae bacterium]|nr:LysR substrate-binding domain-containing protein [Rhodospirillaceae bacterium]MDE0255013.1 LysR substrate-binding domain-containing protein [Rhodospirillaceae bacterium]MDE0617252.1 LysR substrate-binding domain-containing protein [Rhodospirillaceae bacterium]MYF08658.1 LysR family transcriptional regulator [Rhodospirillaceae bacterium]MYJ71372.1 LysR family transcriptional regulator [Rhodospirillaceae bacterium]
MIKLETLRTFVTVAEAGNIRDAAERLCRTASAVSMTLKQLEHEVGGALFETDRKSSLTPLGAFMLETGRLQIQNYDRMIDGIHAYARNRIGRLTLASVPSVAANLVPSLLPRFVLDRPGVEIELLDTDSRNVLRSVESGQADLGIAGRPLSRTTAAFEPLFRDRFKVICNAGCNLAAAGKLVNWADIESQGLILNGASDTIDAPGYKALSEKASMYVRNVTSLLALAKSGFGVTLLPALAAVDLPEDVVALDLAEENMWRVVGLLSRSDTVPSPVALAFRAFILDEVPKLVRTLGLEIVNP